MEKQLHDSNKDSQDFAKLSELVSKNKKQSRSIAVIGIVATLTGIVVLVFNVFHLTSRQMEATQSLNTTRLVIKQKDSLLTRIDDSAATQMREEKKITGIINRFFAVRNTHDMDSLIGFYTDTLSRYYLKERISRTDVINRGRKYWSQYPGEKFIPAEGSVQIARDDYFFTVLVKGRECTDDIHCTDEIFELRLNPEYRIYYVRGFVEKL